ncbi:aldo/keto reductase [Oceanispirochaeta crateris]|uniref:Aldo/keto reductase n=1 Tax=Oceanispirochaeta crateris TaxID=2518645 RepID=A0A5C1QLR2_9SPIO|nr:aldo/keto reductase [Oceanispirochaeta crateris]QEN08268.1 aldo/keto reductase [Oceanispirochaeta crateris]
MSTSSSPLKNFPPMALGTWTFAGGDIWSDIDEKESIKVIHNALDSGISLFDTSPNYGDGASERILGKALKGISEGVIATKMKIDGCSEADIIDSVETSLKTLGRDTIDLMQVHWPGTTEENKTALDTFQKLQKEGKILHIGVCNFGSQDLEETHSYPIISNQLPYNLMWRVIENDIAPLTKQQGKHLWVYSPLQQGLLTGKYNSLDSFPEGRMRTRHFAPKRKAATHGGPGMEAETQELLNDFLMISKDLGITPTELAIRYIRSQSFVDTILVGARDTKQLKELQSIITAAPLDDEVMTSLNECSLKLLKTAGGNPDMYQYTSRVRFS